MMILTENAADPVAEACAAFVCAAAESAEGYTIEQLTEMVTEQVTALNETGGLVSWVKRVLGAGDESLPGEIEKELKKIDTPEKKAKALADVQRYITDAKSYAVTSSFTIKAGAPAIIRGIYAALKRNEADAATYRAALKRCRAEIMALKV
jgi:hypothetical protein